MKFIRALSVFVGTIIGVGIFGLPYIASRAGFFVVFIYFLAMSTIAILIHLLFGKVALGTETLYRLPGFAGEYMGPNWKKITLLTIGSGLVGAILAYLIVGGTFLEYFFAPYFGGNNLIYTLLFFGAGAYLILRGIKHISRVEFSLLLVFFAILIVIFVKAAPFIDFSNFQKTDLSFIALPYGVILFAIWGSSLIPELEEMLGSDAKKLLKRVIVSGILLSVVTYLFFIFMVLGATGQNTSKEAISGLANTLGNGIIRLGFIFGVITCFTSFITLGLTFKKILWYDFGLPRRLSWLIACFLPLILFFLGLKEFIAVIGLTGAISLGFEAIIIVFLYRAFLLKKFARAMNPLMYILPVFFVLGIFFEIYYFFAR
ncbi:MAG: hypothetical protein HYV47_01670 [Candidatus Nealsonbacteria bacterium]|nr:hypothetical protein [Candidatus Nealsonbacteria bacterium]